MDRQGEGLKECPFCGSSARMSNIGRGETRYVFCCGCRASMQSIKEWNTRPPSSQKEPVWPKRNNLAELRSLWGEDSQVVELAERENEIINACIKSWKDSL